MKIKTINQKDIHEAYKIKKDYVDEGTLLRQFRKQYERFSDLFVGCYDSKNLIGICIGEIKNNEVVLTGIAVKDKHWRKGIGVKILRFFDKQVKKLGFNKISVGSAEGYVEKFYLKNGFKPFTFRVSVYKKSLPKDYKEKKYDILEVKNYKNKKIIYIKVEKYSQKLKQKVKNDFNAFDVIYIFKKELK